MEPSRSRRRPPAMENASVFLGALYLALAQSAPYVVLGYFVAAVVREFVPTSSLLRHFGERGARPLLNAVGVGALLPICSCGVVPLGIGAFRSGAARGTLLAFMTAAPVVSPVAVLLTLQLLGVKLALLHIVFALTGALLLGALANRLLGGEREASFRAQYVPPREHDAEGDESRSKGEKVREAARWAMFDLGADVSLDLLVGLSLAAAIVTFVPPDWIARAGGSQSLVSLMVVIGLALPLYTCSVPMIPVVQTLLLLGLSPGAAVAFLFAGPATNLGELNAIRHSMGARCAGFYAGALIALALAGGWVVDHVFYPGYVFRSVEVAGQLVVDSCCIPVPFTGGAQRTLTGSLGLVPTWHAPFTALLALTILIGLGQRVLGLIGSRSEPREAIA